MASKAALKSAVKQAVEQAVVKLGAVTPAPRQETRQKEELSRRQPSRRFQVGLPRRRRFC